MSYRKYSLLNLINEAVELEDEVSDVDILKIQLAAQSFSSFGVRKNIDSFTNLAETMSQQLSGKRTLEDIINEIDGGSADSSIESWLEREGMLDDASLEHDWDANDDQNRQMSAEWQEEHDIEETEEELGEDEEWDFSDEYESMTSSDEPYDKLTADMSMFDDEDEETEEIELDLDQTDVDLEKTEEISEHLTSRQFKNLIKQFAKLK
jgi:signal recognition particle GTPase